MASERRKLRDQWAKRAAPVAFHRTHDPHAGTALARTSAELQRCDRLMGRTMNGVARADLARYIRILGVRLERLKAKSYPPRLSPDEVALVARIKARETDRWAAAAKRLSTTTCGPA